LLEDLSGHFGPKQWAQIAVSAYERHKADRIVAERNYGGAMVEAVIRAEDSRVPFSEVVATRGKVVRAEPIAAIYEQGNIHHIGYFPEIEDQLLAMTTAGYQGLKSPDRADALIWGFTELFPMMTRKNDEWWSGKINYPQSNLV
jgi:phage terminase large subunit-like protein